MNVVLLPDNNNDSIDITIKYSEKDSITVKLIAEELEEIKRARRQ